MRLSLSIKYGVKQLLFSVVGSLSFSVAYGIDTLSDNDPYLAHSKETIETLASIVVPGAFWVV